MEYRKTTFPHFIGLDDLSEPSQRFWLNANLIEQISPSSYRTAESLIIMRGGAEIYVSSTPEEILERIYDDSYFTDSPKPEVQ